MLQRESILLPVSAKVIPFFPIESRIRNLKDAIGGLFVDSSAYNLIVTGLKSESLENDMCLHVGK